jgi:hypothetical protein
MDSSVEVLQFFLVRCDKSSAVLNVYAMPCETSWICESNLGEVKVYK